MTESVAPGNRRTLIGVLASQDSRNKNEELAQSLLTFYEELGKQPPRRGGFHFLLTGGTFERVVLMHDPELKETAHAKRVGELLQAKWEWPEGAVTHDNWDPYYRGSLLKQTRAVVDKAGLDLAKDQQEAFFEFISQHSTVLPSFREGGVTLLAHLIVRRVCSILWILLSPNDMHWLNPDNLALMRLCDHFRGKRLMNFGSIHAWIEKEARDDAVRNTHSVLAGTIDGVTLASALGREGQSKKRCALLRNPLVKGPRKYWALRLKAGPGNCNDSGVAAKTVALIAHNEMKDQMAHFALDYEDQLSRFRRILATGTTGKLVQETAPSLAGKVLPLHSGPKGGDVEIAVEILAGRCQYVVFFVDPLRPHPHIDDVRVVFGACMRAPNVQIFTNEAHAREWMERRRREQ